VFKETVVASKLREKMAYFFDLVTGDSVIQILHRGGEVKVLMTQEHYLNLLARLSLYEKKEGLSVESKSVDQLAEIILSRVKDFKNEKELVDHNSQMAKVRRR